MLGFSTLNAARRFPVPLPLQLEISHLNLKGLEEKVRSDKKSRALVSLSLCFTQLCSGRFDEEVQACISWYETGGQYSVLYLHISSYSGRELHFVHTNDWTTPMKCMFPFQILGLTFIWLLYICCSRIHFNLVSCSEVGSYSLYLLHYIYLLLLTTELQAIAIASCCFGVQLRNNSPLILIGVQCLVYCTYRVPYMKWKKIGCFQGAYLRDFSFLTRLITKIRKLWLTSFLFPAELPLFPNSTSWQGPSIGPASV